jgi:hypothetical protein
MSDFPVNINATSKENVSNKSTNVNADQASNTKYPSVKALFDWATALFVPTTRTINGLDLSANRTLTASDVGAPSGSGSSTGTNTGDETQSSILTKIGAGNWVDYSDDSTIVGWSSFTNKLIYYKYLSSDLMAVFVQIAGVSNSTTAIFTMPIVNNNGFGIQFQLNVVNNGSANVGRCTYNDGSDVVDVRSNVTASSFTASGTKAVVGQFLIPIITP